MLKLILEARHTDHDPLPPGVSCISNPSQHRPRPEIRGRGFDPKQSSENRGTVNYVQIYAIIEAGSDLQDANRLWFSNSNRQGGRNGDNTRGSSHESETKEKTKATDEKLKGDDNHPLRHVHSLTQPVS